MLTFPVSMLPARRLVAALAGVVLVVGLLALVVPSAPAQAAGTGHITGTVTTPANAPDAGADVYVFAESDGIWDYTEFYAETGSDGRYDVSGLPAGTYRIQVEDYGSTFAPEFYNNKATVESADDIVVADGATVSGKNVQLGYAGHIYGRVIAPSGRGLGAVVVYVSKQVGDHFEFVNLDYTNDDGYYYLGLSPGTYRLFYNDSLKEFAGEYYDNAVNEVDGKDVIVVAGRDTNVRAAMLGTVKPNVWKSTAKVAVSAYRRGNVSVSCTQACSGWAQVWSDGAGSKKSGAKYFSMTKAGYKTLAFTDLPYVDSTTAKVRIAKRAPDESPNPQFNALQLVKGPQNVVKTTAKVRVSAAGKAKVNISCTMACEGYAQLRSDEAGTKKSGNVVHYKLSKAGYTAMYFTGVPNIDSDTWLTRLAMTVPSTSVSPQFNPLSLARTAAPVNTLKTTAKVTVSAAGKAKVNISCTMACEGWAQLRSDEAGTKKSDNVVFYRLSKAGYTAMYFTGVPHIDSATWLTRVAIKSPATSTSPIFNPLELVSG